jgi:hypothetical protein
LPRPDGLAVPTPTQYQPRVRGEEDVDNYSERKMARGGRRGGGFVLSARRRSGSVGAGADAERGGGVAVGRERVPRG